jgi:hypothetical protein
MNYTLAFCISAMLLLFGAMVSPRIEIRRPEKWFLVVWALGVMALILFVWLWAIRDSQLAPHKITNSINGRVISSFWTTNPAHITWEDGGVPGSPFGGLHPVINYYWNVWTLFKK